MKLGAGQLLLDRYSVERTLGAGGSATSYLALDRLWHREVALKLLRAPSAELRAALRTEFAMLQQIAHAHLCQVLDFGAIADEQGEPLLFYTYEYVRGCTLAEHARGRTWTELRGAIVGVVHALRQLHRLGIVHGDVKPDNILVQSDGASVLIDLGCARPMGAAATNLVSGTEGFIAPERMAAEPTDQRADLYALGQVLMHLEGSAGTAWPRDVGALANRLTRQQPVHRPADADEVLEALGAEPARLCPSSHRLGQVVGRNAELDLARGAWTDAAARRPGARVVHLTGPAGIGRSRLLREIKWEAQLRARVIEANAEGPGAITNMIGQALGQGPLSANPGAVVEARAQLAAADRGVLVFVLDDAQQLAEEQAELLRALARCIEAADPVVLVVASVPPFALDGPALRTFELEPLTATDVAEWLGDEIAPTAIAQLVEASQGRPAALRALLPQLIAGEAAGVGLLEIESTPLSTPALHRVIAELDEPQRTALGHLGVLDAPAGPREIAELDLSAPALRALAEQGVIERQGSSWKLARTAARAEWLEALGRERIEASHGAVARWLEQEIAAATQPRRRSELAARRASHLASSGQVQLARPLLERDASTHDAAPRAWLQAVEAMLERDDDAELQIVAARLERQAGQSQAAAARLSSLLERALSRESVDRARCELGACQLALGHAQQAIDVLRPVADESPDLPVRLEAANQLSRALTKRGDYQQALDAAARALAACEIAELEAELHTTAGMAASYLGKPSAAGEHLARATELFDTLERPRDLVRALGTRALCAFRVGELRAAELDYRRALEVAEQHVVSDQLATAALNLGTVCHQRGAWAEALACYERGLRVAVALRQQSTELVLRYDLAKLYCDLGLFDRAQRSADGCLERAQQGELSVFVAMARAVLGEIAFARGDRTTAQRVLELARDEFERRGSAREQTELEIQLAEVALASEDRARAAGLVDECAERLRQLEATDVEAQLGLLRARLELDQGRAGAAIDRLDRTARIAADSHQIDLQAQAELLLAEAWAAQSAPGTASSHQARARELWERSAAPLEPAQREAFWQHPRRSKLASLAPAAPATASTGRQHKLELLLDINKRLNSTLTTPQVLQRAMDAAIELTSAERGFVLLAPLAGHGGELDVAIARNLDREQLGRSHLKFSHAIAEQVIWEVTSVVTADAQVDDRFRSNRSVHAMQLRSVACVPICSPVGVLGALYLDNRFQRGRFSPDDVAVLTALADQVAIALTNARLVDQLAERNRQLEAERQRVEELAQGQAAEIDRLIEQVREQQESLERRYDYSGIVGSSPAMQRVFDLLERVIDTGVAVLIGGESGTGKELIARAIHFNGPRRESPLVAVNCGALPDALLESELFGYLRGAFTGAERDRQGLIAKADGGTLFLDELSEMSLSMQAKLLRVLQDGKVHPLGATEPTATDFRLICATNRKLVEQVERGAFREDLYYRINIMAIDLPPLRRRLEDLPELAHHILHKASTKLGREPARLESAALRRLASSSWPGNVRQLENVLTRAVVMAADGVISEAQLELGDRSTVATAAVTRHEFEQDEKTRITEMLARCRWNVSQAARRLGIPRATMYRTLKRYELNRP